jgi:hypothetical protein
VKSFNEVTIRLRQIGNYLDKVDALLDRIRWDKLPKRSKRKKPKWPGGEDVGSKPPKGWPP